MLSVTSLILCQKKIKTDFLFPTYKVERYKVNKKLYKKVVIYWRKAVKYDASCKVCNQMTDT